MFSSPSHFFLELNVCSQICVRKLEVHNLKVETPLYNREQLVQVIVHWPYDPLFYFKFLSFMVLAFKITPEFWGKIIKWNPLQLIT